MDTYDIPTDTLFMTRRMTMRNWMLGLCNAMQFSISRFVEERPLIQIAQCDASKEQKLHQINDLADRKPT